MAIKFTDLPQLSGTPSNDDVVAIVDVSEDVSKKITVSDLVSIVVDETGFDSAEVSSIVSSVVDNAYVEARLPGSVSADNYIEGVDSISGTSVSIDPSNGSLAIHALSGTTTYSYAAGWVAGESITLHITSNGNTVNWPITKWVGGEAPDLSGTDGVHIVNLWKIGSDVYGAYVGEAS